MTLWLSIGITDDGRPDVRASDGKERDEEMAELTVSKRKNLRNETFAIVTKTTNKTTGEPRYIRKYPIPDREHAINALARVEQFGTPAEKAAVRRAVKKRFPNLPYFKKEK